MAAVTDYPSLVDNVKTYVARSDTRFTNQIHTFISLAEDRIYEGAGASAAEPTYSPPVRVPEMATEVTISFVDGEGVIPNDCITMRTLYRDGDTGGLDYLAPDKFTMREAYPATSPHPRFYTVVGRSLKLIPKNWTGDLQLIYYARPPAITPNNFTNDVIRNHGNLYLAGTLFEAYTWLRDAENAVGWLAKYKSAANGANGAASGLRHAGGTLRVTSRHPLP